MKIVQVINKIIENPHLISDVCFADNNMEEIFFLYNKKYKFSIMPTLDSYNIFLYNKTDADIKTLAAETEWNDLKGIFTSFKYQDIKTREALISFKSLYDLLYRMLDNTENILDDIINS